MGPGHPVDPLAASYDGGDIRPPQRPVSRAGGDAPSVLVLFRRPGIPVDAHAPTLRPDRRVGI